MIAKLLIALCFLASPVRAEPFSNSGYALGCDDSGCTIFSAGFLLHVANDGSTPARIIRKLATLDAPTAVTMKGTLGPLGDATADLTLTGLAVKTDDRYQDTLRALQGNWQRRDETLGVSLLISGMEWRWILSGGTASFLISPADACADGAAPGGTVLSLYPMGGDPSEAACFQVGDVTATELHLFDVKGDKGQIVFDRVVN